MQNQEPEHNSFLFPKNKPWFSKWYPWTSSIGITWKLVRNAKGQDPSQTSWIRLCILTRWLDDLHAHWLGEALLPGTHRRAILFSLLRVHAKAPQPSYFRRKGERAVDTNVADCWTSPCLPHLVSLVQNVLHLIIYLVRTIIPDSSYSKREFITSTFVFPLKLTPMLFDFFDCNLR